MRRVVLDPRVPREAFEELARELGWSLYRAAGPDELEPYTATWSNASSCDQVVQYTEDDLIAARYVVIDGSRAEDAATAIEQRLETVTADAAVRGFACAGTPEQRARTLAEAVIAADPDVTQPAVLDLIRQALADRVTGLRRTAIAACTYLNWRELDLLLTEVIRRDADPDVVRFACDALALRRQYAGAAA